MQRQGSALPLEPLCVNRNAERARIGELWDRATPNQPFRLAVGGTRGIGKTVLLTTIAYTRHRQYEHVLYYEQPSDDPRVVVKAEDIAGHLLHQSGVGWDEIRDPAYRAAQLRSRIGGQRVLIVLDGIESVGQVLPLLGDLSRAAVLVGCTGDLLPWAAKHFEPMPLGKFGEDDGIELLRRLGGEPTAQADAAVLERLVRVLGGHPALLVVVAAHLALGDESVGDYVTWLENADANEIASEISLGGRSVVRAVCDSAYQDLTTDEKAAYRYLAAIPLSLFDTALAAAVLGVPLRTAKKLIRRLIEHTPVCSRGIGFVEYPRHAAQHALQQPDDEAKGDGTAPPGIRRLNSGQVCAMTFEWCIRKAFGLARTLSPRPIEPSAIRVRYDSIEPEYTGDSAKSDATAEFARLWPVFVSAAVAATERGRHFDAVSLWLAMWPFGYQTVRTSELIDGLEELLRVADDPGTSSEFLADPAVRWQLCRDLGALYERIGETAAAWEILERSLLAGYRPGIASSLEWQALTLERAGRLSEALEKMEQAWAAVAWMENPPQERRSYDLQRMHRGRMMVARDDLGDVDRAETELRLAESSFQERALRDSGTDSNNAALCRILLGDIALRRGRYSEAELYWKSALDPLLAYGMRAKAIEVHGKLADLAEFETRPDDVRHHRQQAADLADNGDQS